MFRVKPKNFFGHAFSYKRQVNGQSRSSFAIYCFWNYLQHRRKHLSPKKSFFNMNFIPSMEVSSACNLPSVTNIHIIFYFKGHPLFIVRISIYFEKSMHSIVMKQDFGLIDRSNNGFDHNIVKQTPQQIFISSRFQCF